MDRRQFFKRGAKAAAAGAAISLPINAIQATDSTAARTVAGAFKTSAILASYTAEDHRRRLANVGICTRKIRTCLRKHLIYAEVKRRGGIYKMHADRANEPQTGGLKVYDYLWVGENVANADGLREATKNHAPYVVPCIQGTSAKVEGQSDHFLHSIPYMQFPLLQGGRPLTGERAVVPIPRLPGVQENGFYRKAWKYYQEHPNGPYIYGGWDPIPPSTETRPAHARWLKQYLPLAADGTWAFLEIADSDLFAAPLPRDCVASAFANRDLYLVLANYGQAPQQVETADAYVSTDGLAAAPARQWPLPKRSLRILRYSA